MLGREFPPFLSLACERNVDLVSSFRCTVTEGCRTKCTKNLLKQHENGCKVQAAQLKKTKTKLKNVKAELRRKRKVSLSVKLALFDATYE